MSTPTNPLIDGLTAINTVEPSASDSTQTSIPLPDAPAPTPDQSSAPTQPTAPQAPPKPSLWKGILAGALQGLAAGSSVNTRGMGSAGAFAAGAGAGANQVLNVVPQQQQAAQTEAAKQANYHANTAKIMYDLHKLSAKDENAANAALDQHADDDKKLMSAGALQPLTTPTDSVAAMQQLRQTMQQRPQDMLRLSPTVDAQGNRAYQVVRVLDSPIQSDVTVRDRFGKDQTIEKGTVTGRQLDQWRMHEQATALDMDQQRADENRKFKQQKELLQQRGDQASDLADAKATTQRANSYGNNVVAFDPEYQNPDGSKGANVVLDKGTAQQRGLFSYKADPSTINANIAGMNDVQTKLNQLAEVANDKSRMSQVQPELAAAILEHGKGIKIGIAGTELDTSRVNEGLYKEDVNSANQATPIS